MPSLPSLQADLCQQTMIQPAGGQDALGPGNTEAKGGRGPALRRAYNLDGIKQDTAQQSVPQ